jgi:hypothetical protein
VPRFFGDVDPHHRAHHRLHRLVVEVLALERVEDLFADQRRHPHRGPVQDQRQGLRGALQPAVVAVRPAADVLDERREHRGVPAFVGDLGQRVVHVPGRRVLPVGGTQQHLHEDQLEPDADADGVDQLLPRKLDPLLTRQAVPQRRAVQRNQPFGDEELVLVQRRGPVHVDVRVVGEPGTRPEQPFRRGFAIGHSTPPCVMQH